MQENEFEKRLKHLMEEFRLSPSDAVWDKVSRRLNKKRRRIMPFAFLLALGLITAGYFIFHAFEKQVQSSNSVTGNIKNNPLKTDSTSKNDSGELFIPESMVKEDKNNATVNNKTIHIQQEETYNKKISSNKIAANNSPSYKKLPSINKISTQSQYDSNNDYEKQVNLETSKQNDSAFVNDEPLKENSIPVNPITIADSSKETANNANKNVVSPDSNDNVSEQSVKTAAGNNYKIPNWQWGITAFYGKSNAIEGLGDFNKSAMAYVRNPGTGNNDTVVNTAHPFAASDAYQFGAVVQKKIVKNGFLSTGINFIHLSTQTTFSQKVDSAVLVPAYNGVGNYYVSQYYQPGSLKNYTSSYNFIELPLYFQQDLLPTKPVSFSYNAGISVRQLLSSQSLIYNQYSNIYFSKDDLVRKTQFQFTAGLSLKINAGKTSSIYIGPQFAYSFSGLLKNTNSNNFHFINYGLQAGFLFHKK